MPVHNGGIYLKKCITSIQRQKLRNFKLIVLENKSTDGTSEWLQKINDFRVKVIPSKRKLSISANFARAVRLPKAKFMTFVGSDDYLHSNYLSEIKKLILKDSNASTYFAHFRYIDKNGKIIRPCRRLPRRETCDEYLKKLFSHKRDTYGTGYVYRSKEFDKIGGFPNWKGLLFADDALWISLMEKSWNANVSKECFSVRINNEGYGHMANWENWIENIHIYTELLRKKAANNKMLDLALNKYAPEYFLGWCNMIYDRLLRNANDNNVRIRKQDVQKLMQVLKKTSPQIMYKFNGISLTNLRKRLLNRFYVTRFIYKRYRIMRYGHLEQKNG